jgi:hypothetical protein
MVGPGTNALLEVGLNLKGMEGTTRLKALPPGGMCQFKVRLGAPAEVDTELLGCFIVMQGGHQLAVTSTRTSRLVRLASSSAAA